MKIGNPLDKALGIGNARTEGSTTTSGKTSSLDGGVSESAKVTLSSTATGLAQGQGGAYQAEPGQLGGGALTLTATRGKGLPEMSVAVPNWRLTEGGFEATLDGRARLDFDLARGIDHHHARRHRHRRSYQARHPGDGHSIPAARRCDRGSGVGTDCI